MGSFNNLMGKKSRSRGLLKIMAGLLGPSHHLFELQKKKINPEICRPSTNYGLKV